MMKLHHLSCISTIRGISHPQYETKTLLVAAANQIKTKGYKLSIHNYRRSKVFRRACFLN